MINRKHLAFFVLIISAATFAQAPLVDEAAQASITADDYAIFAATLSTCTPNRNWSASR